MGATAVQPATPAAPPKRGPLGGVSARLLQVASDERLVGMVRQGSQPAFEVIYDRHHRGILSFCRHMLSSREEAEDAVQHTFMAAYKALLGSDKDIQLRAWLYTIARNRCLSVLRARRELPSDEIEIASTDGLAAEVQRNADLKDLLRDMAHLPEDQRAALVLSELGDMGHDEIAHVLGCPKDKVKALVFQARSSLHQSRDARDTSCHEIREMISTLSGGSLRRTTLRRHIKSCSGCQAFESEVKRQRRAMAVVLPVVPTLGLKESALAAAFGHGAAGGAVVAGGAGAAAAGGSVLAGSGASALVAKVLVVAAVAGGGAAGVSAVTEDGGPAGTRSKPAGNPSPPAGGGVAPAVATVEPAAEREAKAEEEKPRKSERGRRRGQTDRGKEFAKDRGKGRKHGLNGTQPGKAKRELARAKSLRREGRETSAEAKAKAKVKANGQARENARAKTERREPPARPAPARQPQPKPTREPTPQPEPEPEPTPVPEATPAPESSPGAARDRGRIKLP